MFVEVKLGIATLDVRFPFGHLSPQFVCFLVRLNLQTCTVVSYLGKTRGLCMNMTWLRWVRELSVRGLQYVLKKIGVKNSTQRGHSHIALILLSQSFFFVQKAMDLLI